MKKGILLHVLAGFMSLPVLAQSSVTEVVQGDSAELRILSGIGGTAYEISANGRYIVGKVGTFSGFRYDVEKDSVLIFTDGAPVRVADNGIVLGDFVPAGIPADSVEINRMKAGLWENGTWAALEEIPGNPGRIVAYGLSDDGKIAAGYGYVLHPNGKTTHCGVVYDGTRIRSQQLHPAFPYPGATDPTFNGEGYISYGARMNTISGDGNIAVGWGGKPAMDGYRALQRTPHLWDVTDKDTVKTYFLGQYSGDLANQSGEISHTSYDGSVSVGSYGSRGAVWTKKGNAYELSFVDNVNGFSSSSLTGVSETGVYVGYATANQSDRAPFICTPENGTVRLDEYLKELYGLDPGENNLYTPMDISADGKSITGWGLRGSMRFTWCILLRDPILSRPLKPVARQITETYSVVVSWLAPLKNGKEVLGYNIYRDGEKINETPVTVLEFTDTEVPEGKCTYHITAVYADGESKFSDPYAVLVLRPGACYPVQRIGSRITYNREVSLYWGLPSSEIELAFSAGSDLQQPFSAEESVTDLLLSGTESTERTYEAKYSSENHFDYVSEVDLQAITSYAFVDYKGYYYTSDWRVAMMTKISHEGEFVSNVMIPDLPMVRNMTVTGDSALWVACDNNILYQIDPETKSIVRQKKVDITVSHLAWIPWLDEGKGGFSVGNFETNIYVDMNGKKLSEGIPVKNASALVYYEGRLYAALQAGDYHGQIVVFDAKERTQLGSVVEVARIPEVMDMDLAACAAAGMGLTVLSDSTVCLGYVAQLGGRKTNRAFLLEIKSMPKLSGYNLYKDHVKMNSSPLTSRVWQESVDEAGDYIYYVTAQFGDCESAVSDTVTITIYDKGICMPVRNLSAEEINGQVFLTFDKPEEGSIGSLVGLNLYRNEEKLNEDLLVYLNYVDTGYLEIGSYRYCVEAFYDNSCRAFDTIQIDVTHEGREMPVADLRLRAVPAASGAPDKADVDMSWNLPHFESPYPLRWGGNYIADAIGIPGYTEYTVAVGWDTAWVNRFRDFRLVGIEFFLYDKVNKVSPLVLVNEKIVAQEECRDYLTNDFTTYMLSESVSLQDAWEFMVGYTVELNDGAMVIGLSDGPVDYGYGNWISLTPEDPASWQVLGIENNLSIAALLVRERQLEDGSTMSEMQKVRIPVDRQGITGRLQSASRVVNVDKVPVSDVRMSKNALTLKGFNVYRNDEKLNDDLLKDLRYTDADLQREGSFDYSVGAVYSSGEEILSDSYYIELDDVANEESVEASHTVRVYPNPAKEYLKIEGAVVRYSLSDLSGKILYSDFGNAQKTIHLNVSALLSGTYILNVWDVEGRMATSKVVIR